MKRREFLKLSSGLAASLAVSAETSAQAQTQLDGAASSGAALVVDPTPLFDISPRLYMQFMEPLGVTDPSVEAAWDYQTDAWREDFVKTTTSLAPGLLRFGGLFSRYYKWREGVGPAERRPTMRNYVWGGKETNRIGTAEFVGLCKRVGAEALYCVNFMGDGDKRYAQTREGNRTGDAQEAADWVSYSNDPDHAERKAHGHSEPFNIKLWQLGNETSYGTACFKKDEAISATIDFAHKMHERDKSVELIGWGDNGWTADLVERAGEHLAYIAIHMMNQQPARRDTVLRGNRYQSDPERAWDELMELTALRVEKKLLELEEALTRAKSKHPIAITEGHLSLAPQNACPILTEWLTGVYHACVLNLYQRHGDRVKIATAADFNGTRWTSNALIHQVPAGITYLLPAGAVMRLFKNHNGTQGVAVKSSPANLDVAGSRTGDKLFLHVANRNYSDAIETIFAATGRKIESGRVFEIASENPRQEISPLNPDVFEPREHALPAAETIKWRFPARSVSVVELNMSAQG
jgi:alpha-L-arabinofuranosidase